MAYLLDANVFIQAKNLHYGLDFCPAFWEWLEIENRKGMVFSIEKVGDEIEAGDDDLAAWAAGRFTLKSKAIRNGQIELPETYSPPGETLDLGTATLH